MNSAADQQHMTTASFDESANPMQSMDLGTSTAKQAAGAACWRWLASSNTTGRSKACCRCMKQDKTCGSLHCCWSCRLCCSRRPLLLLLPGADAFEVYGNGNTEPVVPTTRRMTSGVQQQQQQQSDTVVSSRSISTHCCSSAPSSHLQDQPAHPADAPCCLAALAACADVPLSRLSRLFFLQPLSASTASTAP